MRKTKLIVMLIILVLCAGITSVYAANSFNATLSSSKTDLKAGDTVTIELGIANINMGTNGMNALEGVLSYDPNVFEAVTSSDIQSLNNWSVTYNGSGSTLGGKFVAARLSEGVTTNQSIAKITLKVKADVVTGSTTIKIKDIASNDGETLILETDKTVTLNVTGKATGGENNQGSSNTVDNSTNKGDNSIAKKPMPTTGQPTYIVLTIAVLALAGYVFFKYNKIKDIK